MPFHGRVLVVAGSDCSGGAGLEADQKVLAAHGCYAMTATTALTVQNTTGVADTHVVPAEFVGRQMEACLDDIGVDVVKTGMLASAATVRVMAQTLAKHKSRPLVVVDPVLVSTSGAQLLPREAVAELIRHVLPLATILTPNIHEAQALLQTEGRELRCVADVEAMARQIQRLGPRWVLVKGGHLPFDAGDLSVAQTDGGGGKVVVDVLVGPEGDAVRLSSVWHETTSTHGTGCSLASAIAAHLARGVHVPRAVRDACRYVQAGIRSAPALGAGHGPLDHFHSTYTLPFSPGFFVEYMLDHARVKDVWRQYIHHPFVMAIGNGTLPRESFKGYITQDYIYLIHFARAVSLAGYKTKDPQKIARSCQLGTSIANETVLHVAYCEGFGVSRADMLTAEEHPACTAYSRYILDVGASEDWLGLQIALASCMLGYGVLAKMLVAHPDTVREGNPYWKWIENYAGDEYAEVMRLGREMLEEEIVSQSPSRVEELVEIFSKVTKMEVGFWEMFPSC